MNQIYAQKKFLSTLEISCTQYITRINFENIKKRPPLPPTAKEPRNDKHKMEQLYACLYRWFNIPRYGQNHSCLPHSILRKKIEAKRLQNNISIYRAELISILLLLTWVNNQNIQLYTGMVIFSDLLSALQAINNTKNENTIKEILFLSTQLFYKGIPILNGSPVIVELKETKALSKQPKMLYKKPK